jgi:hypothetical protein
LLAALLSLFPVAAVMLALRGARSLAPAERGLVAGAAVLCAAVALLAPAAPIHDQWTHFVHLREALADPVRLLDAWDRPGFTLPYAAPAALGITAARVTSAVIAAVAIAATVGAARALGLARPWLAGALLLAQYDFFGQAASTMTELPFAAALALAVRGWVERRPWLVAAGLGWCGITRPEGVLFAALGAAALVARERRAGPAALALLPLALWGAAGALATRDLAWWLRANPYGGLVAPRLELGQLVDSYFWEALRRGQPPVLLAVEAAGVVVAVARPERRLRFLLAPLAVSFLVLTFVRIGLSDEWRESRYLVAVAPALALLAAAGLEAALAARPRAAAAALLALAAAGSARELAWNWRFVLGEDALVRALAFTALLGAAAWLWVARTRWSPRAGVAFMLLVPLACSPPGVYGKQRPEQAHGRAALHERAPLRAPGTPAAPARARAAPRPSPRAPCARTRARPRGGRSRGRTGLPRRDVTSRAPGSLARRGCRGAGEARSWSG